MVERANSIGRHQTMHVRTLLRPSRSKAQAYEAATRMTCTELKHSGTISAQAPVLPARGWLGATANPQLECRGPPF